LHFEDNGHLSYLKDRTYRLEIQLFAINNSMAEHKNAKRVDHNRRSIQQRISKQVEEYGILNTLSIHLDHFHPTSLKSAKKTLRTFLNTMCEGIEDYKYGIVTRILDGKISHHWVASFSSDRDLHKVERKLSRVWKKGDASCLAGADFSNEEVKEQFSNEYYQSAEILRELSENNRLNKSKLFHFSRN